MALVLVLVVQLAPATDPGQRLHICGNDFMAVLRHLERQYKYSIVLDFPFRLLSNILHDRTI